LEVRSPMCIKNGCEEWYGVAKNDLRKANAMCVRCGFSKTEDELRKKLPLTLCEDGLRRKLIPPKTGPWKEAEPDDAGRKADP